MTSASELFYNRRSRVGRDTVELGLESSFDRFPHHNHSRRHQSHSHNASRRDRHDLDACDPLRLSPHLRRPTHRPSHSEREPVWRDESNSQTSSVNFLNSENIVGIRNQTRLAGNGRLPGAVLLARERLLQRLRGVSPSQNRRRSYTVASLEMNNHFELVDSGDWDTEIARELAGRVFYSTDSNYGTPRLSQLEATRKRPPGLTQQAVDRLHLEVFTSKGCVELPRASAECSICLDNFVEGDELVYLPCAHRFHSGCLDPWIRTCGDCPYCRTDIDVSKYGGS